ncbi:MAG: hypothetical protein GC150_00255 [Rhizobiales bacterium]|nr:hypothetical protein [Hyphomicrobiales bacterium]
MTTKVIIWLVALTIAASLFAVLAGAGLHWPHIVVCLIVNLAIVGLAWGENGQLLREGASRAEIGASNARYMGTIWGLAALAMAVTYTAVLEWREWWHFVAGFAVVAAFCTLLAGMLYSRRNEPVRVGRILHYARLLGWAQLAAMAVLLVGLVLDSKMDALGIAPLYTRDNPPQDWAASNIFFAGGFALLLLSWRAIQTYDMTPDAAGQSTTKRA